MKIVIIGGGIAAVYLANNILNVDSSCSVTMLSDEEYIPYDRIHLCRLIDTKNDVENIKLELDSAVNLQLNQSISNINKEKKQVLSNDKTYDYDKLIIATGSTPITLLDTNLENVSVFRNVNDCKKIEQYCKTNEVVLVGSGPIALELLDALNEMEDVKSITLLIRSRHLYDKYISAESMQIMENSFLKNKKVRISYEDEIVDTQIRNNKIEVLKTKKLNIKNPFIVFGIGIKANAKPFEKFIDVNKGILVNEYMQSSDENIYAVGECSEVVKDNFVAGHVKECTTQANVAISHIFQKELISFELDVAVDMLKIGDFTLVEICSSDFNKDFEKVVIESKDKKRVDEYFLKDKKLIRFIGINSNIDTAYLEKVIKENSVIDLNYLYENRELSPRGKLVCACKHIYYDDLKNLIISCKIDSFATLKEFSDAGRVCGRCKKEVDDIIIASQSLIDNKTPRKTLEEIKLEEELKRSKRSVDKFKKLHPKNDMDEKNLESALKMLDIGKSEVNSWISMVTASMKLNPAFEDVVTDGLKNLNKIPIIWLELSDCSGNSEAFIKSSNPVLEELIFDYISLDYHELLMSASGDESETILENIIKNDKGKYVLIVEGAVPLALDGKYLRIGKKAETGVELLKKCAKDAALVLAVGSCAFDGGVVAAYPNPTGAVGVAQALNRNDIINISGCPTNPINIVGTLLSYMMFEELPALDKFNRPLWAYEQRVHDNCERRGHYELGEFVKEWGDDGAKNGWCLFEMGCKGPYANVNCPSMKFNQGTSWPVQVGHGCMGCTELGFFDKFANERVYIETKEDEK
jgi:quinone-reactive Ni/Fe-hydrogenase small subunit